MGKFNIATNSWEDEQISITFDGKANVRKKSKEGIDLCNNFKFLNSMKLQQLERIRV